MDKNAKIALMCFALFILFAIVGIALDNYGAVKIVAWLCGAGAFFIGKNWDKWLKKK